MRYITFEQAEQIPAFQGKTAAQVAGLVADATLLWRYIQGNAWVQDADLRAYATTQGLDGNRTNAGLQLLHDTQRIFGFEDTPIAPATAHAPAPAVAAQQPVPGATGVPRDAPIFAQCTQALDEATVTGSSLVVASPDGPVKGAVSYDAATLRVTFTPAAPLAAATAYSCTLAATVANGSGVPLPSDVSWDFTTA